MLLGCCRGVLAGLALGSASSAAPTDALATPSFGADTEVRLDRKCSWAWREAVAPATPAKPAGPSSPDRARRLLKTARLVDRRGPHLSVQESGTFALVFQ